MQERLKKFTNKEQYSAVVDTDGTFNTWGLVLEARVLINPIPY